MAPDWTKEEPLTQSLASCRFQDKAGLENHCPTEERGISWANQTLSEGLSWGCWANQSTKVLGWQMKAQEEQRAELFWWKVTA